MDCHPPAPLISVVPHPAVAAVGLARGTRRARAMSAGVLWALLGAALWGCQSLLIKRGMGAGDPLVASWITVLTGGISACLLSLLLGELGRLQAIEPQHLLLLLLAGLANYTLGRNFFYFGLRRIGAARASPLGAGWVVVAALIAVPLYGEPLTPRLLLGLGLVLGGGLLLVERRQ